MTRHVILDVKSSKLDLNEAMEFINGYIAEHPDQEVFMDGDLYAIVAEARR